MISFILYDKLSGEIKGAGIGEPDTILTDDPSLAGMEGQATVPNNYIDVATKEVKTKSSMVLDISKLVVTADGVDSVLITGIPEETALLRVKQPQLIISDGEVEFTTDTAGEYLLRFTHLKYLPLEVTIDAN